MTIDYEKEYNNRARVPEHQQIFDGWARDAAAYRAARPKAELGISYGPSPRQILDIFPADDADAPLALFIHGGWWMSLHPSSFSHMAAGPNARGVTVAVAGYDLCPDVTIAQITDQIRNACLLLWRKYRKRFAVYGHSAGGHLTAIALEVPGVHAGIAISGLYDLEPIQLCYLNEALRMNPEEARRCSPMHRTPGTAPCAVAVGAAELPELVRQSREYAAFLRAKGIDATSLETPGDEHFSVLDHLARPDGLLANAAVKLAGL